MNKNIFILLLYISASAVSIIGAGAFLYKIIIIIGRWK